MEIPSTSTVAQPPVSTLFFCAMCSKPFIRNPQYKRHIAYCRKSQNGTRPRSCRACNEAKTKCNFHAPCHRCARKKVACVYDVPRSYRKLEGAGSEGSEEDVAVAVAGATSNTVPVITTAGSIALESTLRDEGEEAMGLGVWNDDLLSRFDHTAANRFCASPDFSTLPHPSNVNRVEDMGFIGMYNGNSLSTTMTTDMTGPAGEQSFTLLSDNIFNNTIMNNVVSDIYFQPDGNSYQSGTELQLPTFSPALPTTTVSSPISSTTVMSPSATATATAASPPPSDIVRSGHFSKQKVQTSIQQTCATMIIDMIHTYPRMMMRRETFPPFVHACSPAGDTEDDQNRLPEHLTNCMGISHAFAVHNDDTRSFVRAMMLTEMRGFRIRIHSLNKYEACSAMQASLLYLIMRTIDNVPHEIMDDYGMISIYQIVCGCVMKLATSCSQTEERNSNVRWKDWIFAESFRRVACVWFILGLVYHVRIGNSCFVSDNFRQMPLPCTKTEWEAKTESQWRTAYQNAASRSSNSLHTFGDLIDAHHRVPGTFRVSERLDIWNAEIDLLGMALNMALYMV